MAENISLEEFNEMFDEQIPQTNAQPSPWRDLPIKKVHVMVKYKCVDTSHGEGVIITLKDGQEFWACSILTKELIQKFPKKISKDNLSYLLVSLGKVKSKNDREYFSYRMINMPEKLKT